MAQALSERAPADGNEYVGDGSVDIRRRLSKTSASGQWKAAYSIMGTRPSLNSAACSSTDKDIRDFEPLSTLLLMDVGREATKRKEKKNLTFAGVQS